MKRSVVVIFCTLAAVARVAHAQEWTPTDVGDVGLAGEATADGSGWTVSGSGADIWGTADAFTFLHRIANRTGFIVVRVADLQATHAFAKAGVMLRASLAPGAVTAILDVKPDGGVEFMTRASTNAQMQYIDGAVSAAPVWLRLGWTGSDVTAWTSSDGARWTVLCSTSLTLPATPEAGVAVTSHDRSQRATAHIDSLAIGVQTPSWEAASIGSAAPGRAVERNGVWTITGAGADIWGTADSFEYLYRTVAGDGLRLVARIDDLQQTHAFAKAGLMLRTSLDAGAASVILDATPGGAIEFMARSSDGGEMRYLAGAPATLPVWLQLVWRTTGGTTSSVVASMSPDGTTWTAVGPSVPFVPGAPYDAGVALTSHVPSEATSAHVEGLSLLPVGWESDEVGIAGLRGNAAVDTQPLDAIVTVEGAGSDVWGSADAFQFVHMPAVGAAPFSLTYRVVSLNTAARFAKAGVMFRDGLDAGAPSVILDAKPDGGVEFMARLCAGCATTYLGGAHVVFPAYLSLLRLGSTFTAQVFTLDPSDGATVGSVEVPMADAMPGLAVTSHDVAHTMTAIFDRPAR